MKNRSLAAVFFLPFVTFGIYSLVWMVKTKGEMNNLGAKIPTAWLLIIPIANIYWLWMYCEGVEKVTNGKLSAPLALVIAFCLNIIGYVIFQSEFNKVTGVAQVTPISAPAFQPAMPAADTSTNSTFDQTITAEAPVAPVVEASYQAVSPASEPTFNPTPASTEMPQDLVSAPAEPVAPVTPDISYNVPTAPIESAPATEDNSVPPSPMA